MLMFTHSTFIVEFCLLGFQKEMQQIFSSEEGLVLLKLCTIDADTGTDADTSADA